MTGVLRRGGNVDTDTDVHCLKTLWRWRYTSRRHSRDSGSRDWSAAPASQQAPGTMGHCRRWESPRKERTLPTPWFWISGLAHPVDGCNMVTYNEKYVFGFHPVSGTELPKLLAYWKKILSEGLRAASPKEPYEILLTNLHASKIKDIDSLIHVSHFEKAPHTYHPSLDFSTCWWSILPQSGNMPLF